MNKTEYIGKLNALYVGEKNCLEELITIYDEKDKEIERLNKELEQEKKDFKETNDKCFELLLENKRLNNIIDNAIKKLNKYRNRKDTWGLWCMEYGDNAEIIKILGGEVKNE